MKRVIVQVFIGQLVKKQQPQTPFGSCAMLLNRDDDQEIVATPTFYLVTHKCHTSERFIGAMYEDLIKYQISITLYI